MSSRFLGHQKQIDYLQKVVKNGRLAHAYLFSGPEGVGKFTLAMRLAKFLNCERAEPALVGVECVCASCRMADEGAGPAVFVLSPERTLISKKETRKDIPVGDIRELKRRLALAAPAGKWQVAIVDQADKMSIESSNAFLKLLEEPGERTLLILVTDSKENLLPTVTSRAQLVNFYPLSEKDMLSLATDQTKDEDARKIAVWFASGRPGTMSRLLRDSDSLEREKKMLKDLHWIIGKQDLTKAFLLADKAAKEEKKYSLVEYTIRLLRAQLLQGKIQPHPLSLVSKIKEINRVSTLMEETNVNPRLALETMFIKAVS